MPYLGNIIRLSKNFEVYPFDFFDQEDLIIYLSDEKKINYKVRVGSKKLIESYNLSILSGEKFGVDKRFSFEGNNYLGVYRKNREIYFPNDIGLVRIAHSVNKTLLFTDTTTGILLEYLN